MTTRSARRRCGLAIRADTLPMDHPCPKTAALIERGITEGLHLGAQLYVSHGGRIIASESFGHSRPGVAMTRRTINLWMSSGKPVVAVAIAKLWEKSLLQLDDRIERFIPEFGAKGKSPITIRQILTHTGGFRAVVGLSWEDSFESAVEKVCAAPLEPRWIPGKSAGYHPASGWYVLAELVRRIDGRGFDRYVRDEIFLPAGMNDCWMGMPKNEFESAGERMGILYDTKGASPRENEVGNTPAHAAVVRPGANARGPIEQLARLYEYVLNPRVSTILKPQTIEALCARHRTGVFDATFRATIDWGLGVIVNSEFYAPGETPYGFGPHASRRTFGHSGQESSCAFRDPEHELVVAWLCNALPGEPRAGQRQRAINRAIYEDLGLVASG